MEQDAKECITKAIEIDPNDSNLKDDLNEFLRVENLYKEALDCLTIGKLSDALMETKQILKICPNFVNAKIKYVEILARMGETQSAIERSNEFLSELSTNVDYLYARGLALYYDGQP